MLCRGSELTLEQRKKLRREIEREHDQHELDKWIRRGYLLLLAMGLVIVYLNGGIH